MVDGGQTTEGDYLLAVAMIERWRWKGKAGLGPTVKVAAVLAKADRGLGRLGLKGLRGVNPAHRKRIMCAWRAIRGALAALQKEIEVYVDAPNHRVEAEVANGLLSLGVEPGGALLRDLLVASDVWDPPKDRVASDEARDRAKKTILRARRKMGTNRSRKR